MVLYIWIMKRKKIKNKSGKKIKKSITYIQIGNELIKEGDLYIGDTKIEIEK